MKLVRCPSCGFVCKKNGKTNAVLNVGIVINVLAHSQIK